MMKKVKLTRARNAVLSMLGKRCGPLSADDIRGHLGNTKINKVTIYRALTYLETHGLIRRIDLHREAIYYELAESHHHHLVCDMCGIIEEIHMCISDRMMTSVLKHSKRFNALSSHSLEFFGICTSCAKKG